MKDAYIKFTVKEENWQDLNEEFHKLPLEEALAIMDDATTHGYQFRLKNGRVQVLEP